MGFTFEIAGGQIDGARDYQEDAFLISHLGDSSNPNAASLIIVADGMGGHAAGNVASNLAVQIFNKNVTANYPTVQVYKILRESVEEANRAISETITETAALKGMGCTLVAGIVEDQHIFWVSVGDSHLYLLRDGQLTKKNADHSYGGFLDRMAAEGKEIEPESGYSRSMLMSALTGEEIADIDCPEVPLKLLPGDRLVLASDGMDTLSAGQVVHHSKYAKHPKELIDALLAAVEEAGMPRQDNTTVVAIDVVGDKTVGLASPDIVKEPIKDDALMTPDVSLEPKPPSERPRNPALQRDYAAPPKQTVQIPDRVSRKSAKTGNMSGIIGLLVLLAAGAGVYVSGVWRTWLGDDGTPELTSSDVPDQPVVIVEDTPEPPPEPVDELPIDETPKPEATLAPIEEFRDALKSGGSGPLMVALPAASFEMGAPSISTAFDERPRHEVSIPEFAISKTEVTVADYERFARATGRRLPEAAGGEKSRYPVSGVSWADAVDYARWLSQQTGQTYRLPSEAEWEFAATAGIDRPYPWGFEPGTNNAHCFSCGETLAPQGPTAVASFEPNAFGLHDTSGNVAEWVRDCHSPNYEGAPTDGSAWEQGDCSKRVVRGGSFRSPPKSIRSRKREQLEADRREPTVGIRLARER